MLVPLLAIERGKHLRAIAKIHRIVFVHIYTIAGHIRVKRTAVRRELTETGQCGTQHRIHDGWTVRVIGRVLHGIASCYPYGSGNNIFGNLHDNHLIFPNERAFRICRWWYALFIILIAASVHIRVGIRTAEPYLAGKK